LGNTASGKVATLEINKTLMTKHQVIIEVYMFECLAFVVKVFIIDTSFFNDKHNIS